MVYVRLLFRINSSKKHCLALSWINSMINLCRLFAINILFEGDIKFTQFNSSNLFVWNMFNCSQCVSLRYRLFLLLRRLNIDDLDTE